MGGCSSPEPGDDPEHSKGRAGLGEMGQSTGRTGATQSIPANERGEGKGSAVKVTLLKEGDEKERDARHLSLRRNF